MKLNLVTLNLISYFSYRDALEVCRASGAIKYFYVGLTFGINALVEFGSYGLAFWLVIRKFGYWFNAYHL